MKNIITISVIVIIISGISIIPALTQSSYSIRKYRMGEDSSMVPIIYEDDLLTIDDEFSPFREIKIGDIIAFRAPDPVEENKVLVHRVTAIIENGNNLTGIVILCAPIDINKVIQEKTILTKGDANECSIPGIDFPITVNNYIGKVVKVNSENITDLDIQKTNTYIFDNTLLISSI